MMRAIEPALCDPLVLGQKTSKNILNWNSLAASRSRPSEPIRTMTTKDPRKIYQQLPFPEQGQSPPGSEEEMRPRVDHGESSYKGAGWLKDRRALITGARIAASAAP